MELRARSTVFWPGMLSTMLEQDVRTVIGTRLLNHGYQLTHPPHHRHRSKKSLLIFSIAVDVIILCLEIDYLAGPMNFSAHLVLHKLEPMVSSPASDTISVDLMFQWSFPVTEVQKLPPRQLNLLYIDGV